MSRGFTLVELSIVLVIIGLLIGGILVAQSMIGTAKIQSIARTLQQYDVAVSNFQTKFNSLPGDAKAFNGDGDGYITTANSSYAIVFNGEVANFWVSLQQGIGFNYNGKTFTPTVPASGLDTTSKTPNTPLLHLDNDSAVIVGYSYSNADGTNNNYYGLANFDGNDISQGGAGHSLYDGVAALKPITAYALDSKIDDGNPLSGNIGVGAILVGVNSLCMLTASGPYNINSNERTCLLHIKLLSTAGQGS